MPRQNFVASCTILRILSPRSGSHRIALSMFRGEFCISFRRSFVSSPAFRGCRAVFDDETTGEAHDQAQICAVELGQGEVCERRKHEQACEGRQVTDHERIDGVVLCFVV